MTAAGADQRVFPTRADWTASISQQGLKYYGAQRCTNVRPCVLSMLRSQQHWTSVISIKHFY